MHHVEVGRSLQGENCSILPANMVKLFVGDPERGLMGKAGRDAD